ncbi:MAG TPA: T9SS type A sorting domain-containing protein [Candidatus Kapabacteria bacterium]|nr:T9SS type A sorting domain-containing protein [Candidatus Kapabacteria bacterium]
MNGRLLRACAVAIGVAAFSASPRLAAQTPDARVPTSVDECVTNTRSNVELYHTNNGAIGFKATDGDAGGFWPRGTGRRQYVYGGGLIVGARKRVGATLASLSAIAYNPFSGASWFTPGVVTATSESINRFRLYRSTDYDRSTGAPIDTADVRTGGAYWPVWHDASSGALGYEGYGGIFHYDTAARHPSASGSPVMASSEDIVATYHDRDIARYEGETSAGLPIGLQIEESAYSWSEGPLRDVVVVRYRIFNVSSDTLFDCHVGWLLDLDIGSANNDRTGMVIADRAADTLDLAAAWSERETDGGFGYVGLDVMESPEVDGERFLRRRDGVVSIADEIGLGTFQNWGFDDNPSTAAERYAFMASGDRDVDDARGDKKQLIATGPFNLRPGDTAVTSFGLMFAMGGKGGDPDGTWDDLAPLVSLSQRAQRYFDAAFKLGGGFTSAPLQPTRSGVARLSIAPNPVGSAGGGMHAVASFTLTSTARAHVRLQDARGAVVADTDLGMLGSGTHRIDIETASLPSGLYIVVVDAGAAPMVGRIVISH